VPESRQKTCKRDFAKTSAAWGAVLMPWHLEPGQPETEIKVVYDDGQGTYDAFAKVFRSIGFLETVAEFSQEHYRWPRFFTLKMETCGHPGTDYDDEARVATMCYETPFDSAELYLPSVDPRPGAAAAAAPAAKKRKSR
jgi:hypothetical protein